MSQRKVKNPCRTCPPQQQIVSVCQKSQQENLSPPTCLKRDKPSIPCPKALVKKNKPLAYPYMQMTLLRALWPLAMHVTAF